MTKLLTNNLTVRPSLSLAPDIIIIHPNEGYDLGLMQVEYSFPVYANCSAEEFNSGAKDPLEARICLKNDCLPGTIELNGRYWEKIGEPKKVKLLLNGGKMLILTLV